MGMVLALGLALPSWKALADTRVGVSQNWTASQTATWYNLSQGSRLVPLAWLRALEQPDGSAAFLDEAYVERFRYLPNPGAEAKGLPVGFAVDRQDDRHFSELTRLRWKRGQSNSEPWVGMNCAACHTGEMTFKEKRLRIEGAPTMADFSNFIRALNAALIAARDDPAKWRRFSAKVLEGSSDTDGNRSMLRAELNKLIAWQQKVEDANASPLEYGFGRLDAFGHIFNKVLLRTGAPNQVYNPSDAPVSYPFLWNIHQQDKVQWNGIVANGPMIKGLDVGALGRNVGEVTGVFADLTLKEFGPAIKGYPTSASLRNLIALEKQLAYLKPPAWPAVFPPIQADKWAAGEALFMRECQSCHTVLKRDDIQTPVKVTMTPLGGEHPIGTDPQMACNAFSNTGFTGVLGPWGFLQQGTTKKFFLGTGREKYGGTASVADMLSTTVLGSIWYRREDVIGDVETLLNTNPLFEGSISLSGLAKARTTPVSDALVEMVQTKEQACLTQQSDLLAYKGRPLNGIWATPPYLHNGSVPSLYELMLPPNQRVPSFKVGTREFDPQRVGFVTDATAVAFQSERAARENTFLFNTRSADGKALAGNSNLGHDYGNARLTDEDRWALVEYMKAVGGRRVGSHVQE